MAEYIEREKFRNILEAKAEMAMGTPKQVFYNTISMLDFIPAADVVEVVHGEWLKTDAYPHRVYCSLCFKTYVTNEEAIQGRGWHPVYCTEAEYCPHCGAKMDGEKK